MPIYEFYSPDTHRIYSFYARSLAQRKLLPRCPDRDGARMERLVSRFAVVTGGREAEPNPEAIDSPDPRMEQAMMEMERELSTMKEDHPDPRQLGRLMRKLTEATGRNMPETMEQMIRRLERGEDPERLEAEYGDTLEHLGDEFSEATEGGRRLHRLLRRKPSRDPKLYEMSDYV